MEEEFISNDYPNYPERMDDESLEHMLDPLGFKAMCWGLEGTFFSKKQKDMSTRLYPWQIPSNCFDSVGWKCQYLLLKLML